MGFLVAKAELDPVLDRDVQVTIFSLTLVQAWTLTMYPVSM